MRAVLKPGKTCWRAERAERAALLIDMADYFLAAKAALLKARSTVHLLNWAFDPDTLLDPQPGGTGPTSDRFGPFLRDLACARPELDVRILCWKSALPVSATQHFFPHRAKRCFDGTPVHFLLDATVPMGACHHQKMIIIDDDVAFCGGGDIGPDRWDTTAHLDDDPRRQKSKLNRKDFASRHELMSVLDGAAAQALGELFRERWLRATGHQLAPAQQNDADAWPGCVDVDFKQITVGISRTQPGWKTYPEVRENESLYLEAIGAAQSCIYLENQYFTSPLVAEALATRLAEPTGPEVLLISTEHSPSWFDQMTMDRTRSMFLKQLKDADAHGRLHAYVPLTEKGRLIIVHAKLSIIDDRLLRVGSANLNNRSGGFDTECDVSFEAEPDDRAARETIEGLRTRLLAHWLGCSTATVSDAVSQAGGVGAGIELLRQGERRRLSPLGPKPLGPLASFIASHHLGDPIGTADSWRPWKRKTAQSARRAILSQAIKDGAFADRPTQSPRPA
jgi:phosphatidylserine/phosphatidylglycerophosphate/cardiolipin synthase-like enzyme